MSVGRRYPVADPRDVPHNSTFIGTHDEDGERTFLTPGEVCVECSDADTGRWVPVSFCDRQHDEAGESRG